jgi:amino acid adenylation domain-containing protein
MSAQDVSIAAGAPDELPEVSLIEYLLAVAQRYPKHIAVESGTRRLTYGELLTSSGSIAASLISAGVASGDRIAVLIERSIEAIVAAVAVLRTGAIYVPLDPEHPQGRLEAMIDLVDPKFIVTLSPHVGRFQRTFDMGATPVGVDGAKDRHGTPGMPAIIFFTSGSTGRAKGVVLSDTGIINELQWTMKSFALKPGSRCAWTSSPAFAVSRWEVWSYLGAGATIVVPEAAVLSDSALLAPWLVRANIDVSFLVTAIAEQLMRCRWPAKCRFRLLVTGGEQVRTWPPPDLPFKVMVSYGITETSSVRTVYDASSAGPRQRVGLPPIGFPISNTAVYVLDPEGRPVPRGTAGELHIGGLGLALGYFNDCAATAERFVDDPFAPSKGARMYRTGDLAIMHADGSLEFVGRAAGQDIKMGGVRTSPGEVEAALMELPGITEAAVTLVERAALPARFAAWLVHGSNTPASTSELRALLTHKLMPAAIPIVFRYLPSLPRNAHGKIDRLALAAAFKEATRADPISTFYSAMEERIAQLWGSALGFHGIERDDDFFVLGGSSAELMWTMAQLRREFSPDIRAADLYKRPILRDLATFIDGLARPNNVVATPRPLRQDNFPFLPSQIDVWLHQHLADNSIYNETYLIRLSSHVKVARVKRALDALARAHDLLRARVVGPDDAPWWKIDSGLRAEVMVVQRSAAYSIDDVLNWRMRPFDLRRGLAWRAAILSDGPRAVEIELTMHHLITDGSSAAIVVSDIALALSDPAGLATASRGQYSDHVAEVLSYCTEQAESYWSRRFSEPVFPIRALTLAGRRSPSGQDAGFLELELEQALLDAVSARCESAAATLFMGCFTAWSMTLCHWFGERKVVVLTFESTRNELYRSAIGYYINTLPIRVEITSADIASCLQDVRAAIIEAVEHSTIPLHRIMQLSASGPFVLQTAFSFDPSLPTISGAIHLEAEILPGLVPKFALSVSLIPTGSSKKVQFEYDRAVLGDTEVARIGQLFIDVLRQVANGAAEVDWQAVLATDERPASPADESEIQIPDLTLDALVAASAKRNPDAVAIYSHDGEMRYGELLTTSGRICAVLHRRGLGPDCMVAVALRCEPRTIAIIIGILMSGAAYVPLDPANPDGRLAQMIEDGRPALVITESCFVQRFSRFADTLAISDLERALSGMRAEESDSLASRDALAYVIFTSGTTGRPKGVAIEHRSIVNHVIHGSTLLGMGPTDRTLQFCSLNWDNSIEEIFFALATSGAIVIRTDAMLDSPRQFFAECRRLAVTVLSLPTAFFNYLADHFAELNEEMPALRLVVFSGECAEPTAVRRWREALPASCRLVNGYGPTEAAVTVTYHDCVVDADPVPIGRHNPNVELYVADTGGCLLPHGAIGELCIAGICLARGYIGRDDLTSEKFPTVDWGRRLRIYRTGDLAKVLPNGDIVVLGRMDDQVKLRGVRVELSEIEHCFRAMPGVARAAAFIDCEGSSGDSLLLAAVPSVGATLDPDALRAHADSALPHFMRPARFIVLANLPTDINGKVDRVAILAQSRTDHVRGVNSEPMTPLQAQIADILGNLLRRGALALDEDFIAAGGHSLMCARANAEFERRFTCRIPLSLFLQSATPRSVAAAIASRLPQAATTGTKATSSRRRERGPVTSAQSRLGAIARQLREVAFLNMPHVMEIAGALDLQRLDDALRRVSEHQSALRLRLQPNASGELELVTRRVPKRLIEFVDLTSYRPEVAAQRCLETIVRHAWAPMRLLGGTLFQSSLIRVSAKFHYLLLNPNHAIADGISIDILTRELGLAYDDPDRISVPLELSYVEYARSEQDWLNSAVGLTETAAYAAALSALPPPLFASTMAANPIRTDAERLTFDISLRTDRAWRADAKAAGCTFYAAVVAAFTRALGRHTRRRGTFPLATLHHGRVTFGTPVLFGRFIDTFVLEVQYETKRGLQNIRAAQESLARAARFENTPFDAAVAFLERTTPSRLMTLCDVLLILDDEGIVQPEFRTLNARYPGEFLRELRPATRLSSFALMLRLQRIDDALWGEALFDPARIAPNDIPAIIDELVSVDNRNEMQDVADAAAY